MENCQTRGPEETGQRVIKVDSEISNLGHKIQDSSMPCHRM